MTGLTPPCWVDPNAWDQVPHRHRVLPPVEQLQAACLTQCPVLDRCRALDTEGAYGVVAGEYRPWPTDSRLLMANVKLATRRTAAVLTDHVRTRLNVGDLAPEPDELARWCGVDPSIARAALRLLAKEKILIRRNNSYGHPWKVAKIPTACKRTENAA